LAKINEIQNRRRAREIALQMCYLFDVRKIEDPDKAMETFEVILLEQKLENDELEKILERDELEKIFESDEYTLDYARELISGIVNNRFEIDGLIRMNMTGWRPERMGIIDRSAVFLALYEGVVGRHVDIPVAISEAVNLARLFGSDESARFVNGVLGRIVRAIGAVNAKPDALFVDDDFKTETDEADSGEET